MTEAIHDRSAAARPSFRPRGGARIRSGALSGLICLALTCATNIACAATSKTDAGVALLERYALLQDRLRTNQFGQPLVLDSTVTPARLQGDIYAIVAYPLGMVSAGLGNPKSWCDVMLLHINTKYCHVVAEPSGTTLKVNIGSKKQEELTDSGRIEFKFSTAVVTSDYVEFLLDAKDGPLGTSDYHIRLEAVALPKARAFLHLTYSYAINLGGRLAVQTYLATVGSNKVGFTETGTRADGQADYIGGVRGLVERNTMRYYLAIDSFLGAVDMAQEARLEQRLQSWFAAVERYPRQLHEVDREEYLEMKRAEYLRQQTLR